MNISRRILIWNAQFLSRIGFVQEDIKGIERLGYGAVFNKSQELGHFEPCLEEANRTVFRGAEGVGESIKNMTRDLLTILEYNQIKNVYPYISDMEEIIRELRFETLTQITFKNPTIDFEVILGNIKFEIYFFEVLYQLSAQEILEEMRDFEQDVRTKAAAVYKAMDSVTSAYRTQVEVLIDSLVNCE